MDERTTDRLIESIDNLTAATTEVAVKLKRLANSNPITPEIYREIIKITRNEDN